MEDQLTVTVKNRDIFLDFFNKEGRKVFAKKVKSTSASKILQILDKINKCNKHRGICLFNLKSVTGRKPKKVVFTSDDKHSTARRVVFISLKALAWSGVIKLSEK